MKSLTAILSLLHQSPTPSSVQRRFRREPVLAWTLRRLALAPDIQNTAILCWEDQLPALEPLAREHRAFILAKGPRCPLPAVEAIAAARRWSDGWRGGLLSASTFDLGFYAPWFSEIRQRLESEAVLLIDPDAALVDPELLAALAAHARAHPRTEFCFAPAAPGLCAAILRTPLLDKLAETQAHLGGLLSYSPDLPGRDPIAHETCAPVPTPLARATASFLLNSDRQIRRFDQATSPLNGALMRCGAETLLQHLVRLGSTLDFPRDITLELTCERTSRPIFSPISALSLGRPPISLDCVRTLFSELASYDDLRLTLAGAGDPLAHPHAIDIIHMAHESGLAIHVETDLLCDPAQAQRLGDSPADLLSIHLPATSRATYQQVMGCDRLDLVLENIRQVLARRKQLNRGTPLVIPTFMKCRQNLAEMEPWYDYWHRTVGCAVITGPSDFAGQIPDVAAADMAPPLRVPCRRLASRLSILCDGSVVACEQDVRAAAPLGRLGDQPLADLWSGPGAALRARHDAARWDHLPLCADCREWHRP